MVLGRRPGDCSDKGYCRFGKRAENIQFIPILNSGRWGFAVPMFAPIGHGSVKECRS